MVIDLLHKAFADHFPIQTELLELAYVEVEQRDGGYAVVVRLIAWEPGRDPDTLQIRDVTEQSVWVTDKVLDLPTLVRLRELLAAMTKVLPRALEHPQAPLAMPHDLLDFTPLAKKIATEAEFVKALERSRHLAPYLSKPA